MHLQFLRDVLTAHPDFSFVLPGYREVVGKLHAQPRLWRAAEGLGEPDSHLWANAGFTRDDVIESLSADAEYLCPFGNRQPQRLKAGASYAASGMRRIFHGHGSFLPHVNGSQSAQL